MHDAAHAFNLPGTAAYREADKVFKHGMKHIERSRNLVLTPTPSPSPSARPSALPNSERATPTRTKEIKPEHLIPEAMLDFPANSLQAKAVGWNLTGGRRVRAKRLVRGREKFVGKWRDNLPDGSYDFAEMDDPVDMLEHLRTRTAKSWKEVPDWPSMYEEDEDWWEWDGIGGPTGQPPLPGTARLKPKPLRMKTLNTLEFGRFDEVSREIKLAREAALPDGQEMPFFSELDDVDLMAAHLRPDASKGPKIHNLPPQNFIDVNAGKSALNYVYDMGFGDVRGEAYAASVKRFLRGIKGDGSDNGVHPLEEYVTTKWHGGVLQTGLSQVSRDTANALSDAARSRAPSPLVDAARTSYSRIALRRLTSAENPLDLQPLLREPSDFLHVGVGGKSGVEDALSWVGNEIARAVGQQRVKGDAEMSESVKAGVNGKRAAEDDGAPDAKRVKLEPNGMAENANEGNGAPPKTEKPVDGENGLRQLRLELVALTKFYPLASLRKMEAADAARLLPANVRNLMTRQPSSVPAPAPSAAPVSSQPPSPAK